MEFPSSAGIVMMTPSAQKDLTSFFKQGVGSYTSILVLSDRNVFALHGKEMVGNFRRAGLSTFEYLTEPGEQFKTLETAEKCWQAMHEHGMDRSSLIIGFGGGVVTDVAGFVASCYMRGIDVMHVPTTLLAMVDAAIGGKTGVNLASGKNLVGTFYQPKQILISLDYLTTLPTKELSAGLAEVIKVGVIGDPILFEFLEQNIADILCLDKEKLATIVQSASSFKAKIVDEDEKEKGRRGILNYGHTFGHAIETATEYRAYLHGEAISIGMCCAAHTGRLMGFVDDAFVKRQNRLCQKAGLPTLLPASIDSDRLIELMQRDKKTTAGKIKFILPKGLGQVVQTIDVPTATLRKALDAAREESND
jgi:3-dehydroquinate synthase